MSRSRTILLLAGGMVLWQFVAVGRPAHAQAVRGPQAAGAPADDERERLTAERFLALLEKNPRRGTALDRVYGYHVERGTLEELLRRYNDRTAKDSKDGAAWLLLGLIEAQRGKDAAAVAAFRRAEAARPDDPLASYYLGQTLVLVGRTDAAAEAFERAIARKPARADLLPIFQALGRVHQRAYHTEKALEVWGRLEKLFPDDLRVQEQIASDLAEEAGPDRALPRYEALSKKATDPYRKVQFRIEAAELKVRLNRLDDALADFESLLGGLEPESWLARDVRHKIEEVFLRNDDQAGLASYYERWLKKNPEDIEAMTRLGRALALQGRSADARAWLDRAVKLAPKRKEIRLALADRLIEEKKFAEAAAQYEEMVKTDPANPDLVRDWGRLLLRDISRPEPERKRSAAVVWRKLTAAKPGDAATAVLVADLFRQAEMTEEAVALYRAAIALAPESPQYYEYLGEYYHSLKRTEEAFETWGRIGKGANRNAKNLERLAEVLAGFGYVKEAIPPAAEACLLEPDSLDFLLRHAGLLVQAERHAEALKQLDLAAKQASEPEQAEAVLDLRIKTYQATDRLGAEIAALRQDLDATAERWRTLARFLEADQKPAEAVAAIGKAVALDGKSVASWTAYARLHEASGDLGGAVEAYRTLAKLDRRALTENLTQVARLEVRLGRKDRALEAGREVLAASPGNPESYQFFAGLCLELGAVEEGLNALRRGVRVNPNDNKALITLGEALASEFRTEEAIELYWRAFDRAPDLDAKLALVARLAELYLQRNQFDRLVARLEREQREAKQPRELAICLAQAYQASGDFGMARAELERLLAANPRDTALLQQLSSLAETDGDLAAAARYQRVHYEVAPSDEGSIRLAQLYLRAGEGDEAEAIWVRMAEGKQEPARILKTVDQLLAGDKPQTALGITGRLLREGKDRWEALYREGVALVALEKPDEAERRFRDILALPLKDDEPSAEVKAQRQAAAKRPAGTRTRGASMTVPVIDAIPEIGLMSRAAAVNSIQQATALASNPGYYPGRQNQVWTPDDFGQARMAALGWLLKPARTKDKEEGFLAGFRPVQDKAPPDLRKLWDWYYLSLVRDDRAEASRTARALSQTPNADPIALWAYLTSLPNRASTPDQPPAEGGEENAETVDKTPPLAPEELDYVLACFRRLQKARKEWADTSVVSAVATELKRAKGAEEAERFTDQELSALGLDVAAGAAIEKLIKRGDMPAFLKLLKEPPPSQSFTYVNGALSAANHDGEIQEMMVARADKQAYADVLTLLDAFFDGYDRPERVAERLKARRASAVGNAGQVGIEFKVGKASEYIEIDFPAPDRFLNESAIQMLRYAFEIHKRNDLMSDLIAHARKRADAAKGTAQVEALIALASLDWWNDEQDEAVRVLSRAVEAAGNDADLLLALAEIRAKRNEPDEALALVDSVEPADQQTMERRELMALNLAVLAGNADRARKAAERLFNLRLDTGLQVQLAAQMHQLGMHDLAEAVLARARRRAGNNTETLVSLMRQYQQQDKMEIAVQVAHQILRQSPGSGGQNRRYQDQNDGPRTEAIQILARSGKLDDLIGRVEAQLKASPNSAQLLQTLADYHKAAGDPDKARAALERLAAVRSGDPAVRYRIGMQLLQEGDTAGALPHLKAALAKDPNLFSQRFWEIQNAFQRAGKLDDLAQLFEDIDLSKLGNYSTVERLALHLLGQEATRPRGLVLFRKVWKAFPQQRSSLIASMYSDEVWKLPEMYDYAREAILPAPGQKLISRWAGIDAIHGWSSGGEVSGVTDQLLDAAERQNKLEALAAEIETTFQRVPEWSGGKAILVLIANRRGKLDEAKKVLDELLANDAKDKAPIPYATRLILAQALEKREQFQPVVLGLYESANKNEGNDSSGLDFEYHPVRRLVALYQKLGRNADARDLTLRFARRKDDRNYGDPSYALSQRVESLAAIGRVLIDLGYPADAVPLFDEALSNPEALRAVRQYQGGGNDPPSIRQLREGMGAALRGFDDATLARTVRTLLAGAPDDASQALNLVLLIQPREADRATVVSILGNAIRDAARKSDLRTEVKARLDSLGAKHPADLSVQVALALFVAAEGPPERLAETASKLAAAIEKAPLDDLPADARPNARQRAEAVPRLGLWLVARDCWTREATREVGDRLAVLALEAARRQADPLWALAMLREWGQSALDRGDRATAEERWSRMLDLTLGGPATARPKETAAALTLDRFELAAQLATLYAERDLNALSLHAVRRALASGPPVVPIPLDANARGRVIRRNNNEGDEQDQTARLVETRLGGLDVLWGRHGEHAGDVYETLEAIVLPESRPAEVFLYPRPLGDVRQLGSVGEMLVRWAARAGKLDDLRKQIETRTNAAKPDLAARVLMTQWALAARDWAEARRALASLADRLKSDMLQHSAESACLAAIPALDHPETAEAARAVLDQALKVLASASNPEKEPLAGLHLALARAHFHAGQPAEGRKQMKSYQTILMRNVPNYSGDYGHDARKQNLQAIAREYANAGQWSDALDTLGEFVDAPAYRGGDPSIGNVLTKVARQLSARPARERYDVLKSWTLPASNRRSVRLLATYVPEDVPPAVFGDFKTSTFEAGVAGTAGMLIAAAREAETLDDLAREVATLAEQKVENAETLLILTHIARELPELAKPRLKARLDRLKTEAGNHPVLWSDVLLARAALNVPLLQTPGEDFAQALVSQSKGRQTWFFLEHLRQELAQLRGGHSGADPPVPGADPGLAFWHPAATVDANTHSGGSPPPWWVEAEGVIEHVTGPQDDYLLLDFPITGRFEFSVDAYTGGHAEGHVAYGGLVAEANATNAASRIFPVGRSEQLELPSHFLVNDAYNRLTIQVEPGKVRYLTNGHLFYEDADPSPTSPWLALFSSRERQPTFRGLTLTGTPTIPREVALCVGDRLEGWVSAFLNESQPPRRTAAPVEVYDWASREGVIRSRRVEPTAITPAMPGRLYYHRPLQSGDSIAYEFYHEPGAVMVHPALDRLAFLIEPEGVKLHWITDGPDNEWTGLKPDNQADEPANRRGPKTLPLKPKAWNSARIRVEGNIVFLALNGVEVYRRPLEPGNSRQFGLFHFRDKTRAEVRNVVLRGDWPEALTPEILANLAARLPNPAERQDDRLGRHDIVGEETLVKGAGYVLKSARGMALKERYEYLANWVLPLGPDHNSFRLQGEFTPTDAAPPVASPAAAPPDNPAPTRLHTGGQLVSPAQELVATARALGNLDDLAARTRKANAGIERNARGQFAMLALIALAQDRPGEAREPLRKLAALSKALPFETPIWQRWPELVAQRETLDRPEVRAESDTLGRQMIEQWHGMGSRGLYPRERAPWGRQAAYATRRSGYLGLRKSEREAIAADERFPLWSRVEHVTAASRGQGMPIPRWVFRDGALRHNEGHNADYLYLNAPLQGDFELTCELARLQGNNQLNLTYGGIRLYVAWDLKSGQLSISDRNTRQVEFNPPLENPKTWYPCRLVVKHDVYSLFFDGRKVVEEPLPPGHDPWLAIYNDAEGQADLRNLKLNGHPTVPAALDLSALSDLSGWLTYYDQDRIGDDAPTWVKRAEEIVGLNLGTNARPGVDRYGNEDSGPVRRSARLGSKQESLLQYNRPMLEDGEMNYEFFYVPGQTAVHPVLDRLAFVLGPEGVKVHWLTDAQHDRTGLAADNLIVEPENRRGPARPPLKPGEWNRLALKLSGDVVTLSLNGEPIYERALEPTNGRQFGLFHDADETEARVRNVRLEGQWPREVPPDLGVSSP